MPPFRSCKIERPSATSTSPNQATRMRAPITKTNLSSVPEVPPSQRKRRATLSRSSSGMRIHATT